MYTGKISEYQEPADLCGHPAMPTEQHAISRLLMLAATLDPHAPEYARQCAEAFPVETQRAVVRGVRDRARATR